MNKFCMRIFTAMWHWFDRVLIIPSSLTTFHSRGFPKGRERFRGNQRDSSTGSKFKFWGQYSIPQTVPAQKVVLYKSTGTSVKTMLRQINMELQKKKTACYTCTNNKVLSSLLHSWGGKVDDSKLKNLLVTGSDYFDYSVLILNIYSVDSITVQWKMSQ